MKQSMNPVKKLWFMLVLTQMEKIFLNITSVDQHGKIVVTEGMGS